MRIKRFEALDMKTALTKVREELGSSAVIISTREIENKEGLPPSVEITAGADHHSAILANSSPDGQDMSRPQKDAKEAEPNLQVMHKTMENELNQIKELLLDLTHRSRLSERLRNRTDLVRLYRNLIESELDPALARGLIEQIATQGNGKGPDPKTLLMKKLCLLLQTNDPINSPAEPGRPKLVVLVGPCGAGKTTTLAKLAAIMALKKKKKVALISLDSYRLGAVAQLRTYARIMGLPFKAAQSSEDFKQWVELFEDMDLILIDTPGRALSEPDCLEEVAKAINQFDEAIVLLVLSAAAKDRNLTAAIERTRDLPVKGLIISMIDETDRYGNVINNLIKFKTPVSYLTNGQKVPDDIIPATPNRLVALINPGLVNS